MIIRLALWLMLLSATIIFVPDTNEEIEAAAWEELCTYAQVFEYSCEGIEPPAVVHEEMKQYGYYIVGGGVFISDTLDRDQKFGTLLHEYLHHLHWKLDLYLGKNDQRQRCLSEDEAWFLENFWWRQETGESLSERWWLSYPQCWAYFGDDRVVIIELP